MKDGRFDDLESRIAALESAPPVSDASRPVHDPRFGQIAFRIAQLEQSLLIDGDAGRKQIMRVPETLQSIMDGIQQLDELIRGTLQRLDDLEKKAATIELVEVLESDVVDVTRHLVQLSNRLDRIRNSFAD